MPLFGHSHDHAAVEANGRRCNLYLFRLFAPDLERFVRFLAHCRRLYQGAAHGRPRYMTKIPEDIDELIAVVGGVEALVRGVGRRAAADAMRSMRESLLTALEGYRLPRDADEELVARYHRYIRDLHRELGVKPSPEEVRVRTRARVMRRRARNS